MNNEFQRPKFALLFLHFKSFTTRSDFLELKGGECDFGAFRGRDSVFSLLNTAFGGVLFSINCRILLVKREKHPCSFATNTV